MNLVLDDAEELSIKKKTRKALGRILLKGDNITLMMSTCVLPPPAAAACCRRLLPHRSPPPHACVRVAAASSPTARLLRCCCCCLAACLLVHRLLHAIARSPCRLYSQPDHPSPLHSGS